MIDTSRLILKARGELRGLGEEMLSANRNPGPEMERWAGFCHRIMADTGAISDDLTPEDDLDRQPKHIRDAYKNVRRTLRGLAKPPGIKLRLPDGADPARPPVSYRPDRNARDGWLDTAEFQLGLAERAFARDRKK